MSYFFNAEGIQHLALLNIDIFVYIMQFISNILRYAHNQYKSPKSSETSETSETEFKLKSWINHDADHPSTIGRRVTFVDKFFDEQQKHVASSINIRSKWLDRHIRLKSSWLFEHQLLNKKQEFDFQQREKEFWHQYTYNPQRLLNVVYTSINCHLSTRAILNYRKAVREAIIYNKR